MSVKMKRVNIYLKKSQAKFLNEFNGLSISEHVRRAIDQYISKLQPVKASGSQSEGKEGDK